MIFDCEIAKNPMRETWKWKMHVIGGICTMKFCHILRGNREYPMTQCSFPFVLHKMQRNQCRQCSVFLTKTVLRFYLIFFFCSNFVYDFIYFYLIFCCLRLCLFYVWIWRLIFAFEFLQQKHTKRRDKTSTYSVLC